MLARALRTAGRAGWGAGAGGVARAVRSARSSEARRWLADASGKDPARLQKPSGEGRKHSSRAGPVSWTSLMVVVALGCGVLVYFNVERDRRRRNANTKVETTGKPLLGGPFELVNEKGVPVTDATYRGQYVLLYFGFTMCPDICPNELVKMSRVVDLVDRRKDLPQLKPLFISVDPRRDTVEQVRAYIADFHPRMSGLTGTPGQVGRAAKAYRVYFSVDQAVAVDESDEDYVVDHSIVLYLVGPDGQFLDFFPQLSEADEIAERIVKTMENAQGPRAPTGFFSSIADRLAGRPSSARAT